MASRIAEVVYKLRDLFTGPARKVDDGYDGIRRSSRRAADSVERDNQRMSGSFGALARGVRAAAGAFSVVFGTRVVLSGINETANELDRLGKAADRLKIDPGTLSGLEFALERSGVSAAKATSLIDTLQKRTGEAANGTGEAQRAFDALGISVDDFIKLDAEQQLVQIANAMQGVASEEERAALASQLFSKANVDLLNVLNQGGKALGALIAQGKEYSGVTAEMTKAAAAYNDALADLDKQLDGKKFKLLTPVIKDLSDGFTKLGFRDLGDDIDAISLRIDYLQKLLRDNPFAGEGEKREIEALTQRLLEIARAETVAAKATKENAEEKTRANEALGLYQVSVESLTDTFEAQTRAQKANLDQQTRELASARSQQASIEKEFQTLVSSVTQPEIKDVGLIDVFLKIREASNAANKGQSDQAITLARQGGDLLGRLKEKGSETQGTLKYLAEQLQDVANKAAASNTKAEIIDVDQAQQAFDGVKNKFDALKTDAVKAGDELGRAYVSSIQAGIDAVTLQGPQLPAVPDIVREGNSFSHSLRRELERRGPK